MVKANDWLILALLVVARAMFGVQTQAAGALGPLLSSEIAADLAALGALVGAYQLPGMAVALPGGMLSARLGNRLILRAGLLLMLAGEIVFALAPGHAQALLGRVVGGAGGALVNMVVMTMALERFAGPRLGLALGWMLAAFPLGIALASGGLPWVGALFGWRAASACAAAGMLALLLASPLMGAQGPAPRGNAAPSGRPPRWWPVLLLAVAWVGFNASYILMVSFSPAIIVAHGASPAEAGGLVSLLSWVATPMLPLGGMLAARTRRPVLLAVAGLAGMAVVAPPLGLLAPGAGLVAVVLLAGLFGGLAGAPLFSLAGLVLTPASRAVGMGVFYTLYYFAMTLVPPFAGRVGGQVEGGALWVAAAAAALGAATTLVVAAFALRKG